MSEKLKKIEFELNKLSEMISEFQQEQDKQSNTMFDYEKIENYGKTKPLVCHAIGDLDRELRRKYLLLLVAAVELADGFERRMRQLYFISRLYYSVEKDCGILESLSQEAKMIEQSDIVRWNEQFPENYKDVLVTDLLLMCSLDGTIEDVQRNYFGEICTLFNYGERKINAVVSMCKAILLQNDDMLIDLIVEMDANLFKCYLNEYFEEKILFGLESLSENTDAVVVLANTDIGKTPKNLDFDAYGKKKIIFKNCRFTDTKPVIALKTECIFEKCVFQGYSYELEHLDWCEISCYWDYHDENEICPEKLSYLPTRKGKNGSVAVEGFTYFYFRKAKFRMCEFRDIDISAEDWFGGNEFTFIRIEESIIESCKFEKCRIKINTGTLSAYCTDMMSIIHSNNSRIISCDFAECKYDFIPQKEVGMLSSIIYAVNGEVSRNYFYKCELNGSKNIVNKIYNYFICLDKTKFFENTFEQCNCRQKYFKEFKGEYQIGIKCNENKSRWGWEGVRGTSVR